MAFVYLVHANSYRTVEIAAPSSVDDKIVYFVLVARISQLGPFPVVLTLFQRSSVAAEEGGVREEAEGGNSIHGVRWRNFVCLYERQEKARGWICHVEKEEGGYEASLWLWWSSLLM